MLYEVVKPLRYFRVGAKMDIDPDQPLHARLIADGTLAPVEKKPKAEKREKKIRQPKEVKDDSQDE
jgi:hypothetical protein